MKNSHRLIVVSNRLPISITREHDKLTAKQGAGGLVTALCPILQNRGGIWVGWPGTAEKKLSRLLNEYSRQTGYLLKPVNLNEQDIQGFYHGFSNEILWPLFHEFQMPCNFLPAYWDAYLSANQKFADAVLDVAHKDDFIWVHDYHLMHLGSLLKKNLSRQRIGFFIHIPFPPADIFLKLPWRKQIVEALLQYDLIGFQTLRDRQNFFDVIKRLYPRSTKRGRGQIATVDTGHQQLNIGVFPISIDYEFFASTAAKPQSKLAANSVREAFDNRFLIFCADRLDYTKGIPQRFDAFRLFLEKNPDLHGKVCMMQVLVPCREEIPQYQTMKEEIERMVGEINGKFSLPDWLPLHFTYRNIPREELISYYQAADMLMVTSLRDGMNLVAKEYVACNTTGAGILCLSEFAGAAMELHHHAVMINPFDVEGVAAAIRDGMHLDIRIRKKKMQAMRSILRRNDIFRWVDGFLKAAFFTNLSDFPPCDEEYCRHMDLHQGPPWGSDIQTIQPSA